MNRRLGDGRILRSRLSAAPGELELMDGMEFIHLLMARRWATIAGYLFFAGMMATGYAYNLTFVQLGLIDLGTRLVGMSEVDVATLLALFALLTAVVGLGFGLLMTRHGWGADFLLKLRLALAVVVVETLLTALAPQLRTPGALLLWIIVAGLAMGVGVPTTFSLSVDLVPVRDRGYVAAAITAAAYFYAAVFSSTWRVERFAEQMLVVLLPGAAVLAMLASGRLGFSRALARQHNAPEFGLGRLAPEGGRRSWASSRRLLLALGVMFGIYFVDSLGFLRIINTPSLMTNSWHSSNQSILLVIGATHVVAALIAGILYQALGERALFAWIAGIFALVQLMYVLHARLTPAGGATLSMAILYATAVSLYTVVTFALWADLSTPATIARNAALGVALSGWTATFLSTALAVRWRASGMPLDRHLSIVASISILLFIAMLLLLLAGVWARRPAPRRPRRRDIGAKT